MPSCLQHDELKPSGTVGQSSFSLELLLGMVFIAAAEKETNEKPGPGKQSFCSEEPDWCSCEECDVLLTRDCLCF